MSRAKGASASAEHVLVYEHVPKCGGTTMGEVLRRRFEPQRVYDCRTQSATQKARFKALLPEERMTFDLVTGHGALSLLPYLERPHKIITLLRHPVGRFVSNYYHIHRNQSHRFHQEAQLLTLKEFVEHEASEEYAMKMVGRFARIESHALKARPDAALDRAKENLKTFTLVGITEHFDASLLLLWRRMGWRRLPRYIRSNVGQSRTRPLEPDLQAAIADRCALDIRLYEWAEKRLVRDTSSEISAVSLRWFKQSNAWFGRGITAGRRASEAGKGLLRS